ncbi:uncharacterized protein LOC135834630 [Planococcus citri]|uniref:uncharacterized protein LOC135834630 n=1 Tax=Planococcus citri TaxID=170843 RepID=UPI0031F88514
MAEETRALYCGYPARIVIAISLLICVFFNAILLNNNGPKFLKHLMNKNEFKYTWYFTLLQPIVSYFAVLILIKSDTQSSSRSKIWTRTQTVLLACISCMQILEFFAFTALQISIALSKENDDVIWMAIILLCCCFHSYSSMLIMDFAFETSQRSSKDDNNGLEDVVISSSPSDASPPSYDDVCSLESENAHKLHSQTPPPSYAAIFNFPADNIHI